MSRPTALISGAAGGIGRATAALLARRGWDLFLTDLVWPEDWPKFLAEVETQTQVRTILADLIDPAASARVVAEALKACGRLDGLAHCAGMSLVASVLEQSPESWARVRAVNLDAAFYLAQACARAMTAGKSGGSLVLVSSIGYLSGGANPAYGASKAGVISLTYALAQELGPRGLRVNAVAPGVIDTAMVRGAFSGDEFTVLEQAVARRTPLRRLGRAEDVAGVIAFLLSDAAAFVTGAVIPVTGGLELLPKLSAFLEG
ncbi:MAG: SDR family oxidoreductase [Thermodesulfobacteriota bacterium]